MPGRAPIVTAKTLLRANAQVNPNDGNFGQAEKQELLTVYHAAGDTSAFPDHRPGAMQAC
jgi:hypothetical protein